MAVFTGTGDSENVGKGTLRFICGGISSTTKGSQTKDRLNFTHYLPLDANLLLKLVGRVGM
jgi:hypothetical protein